MRCNRIFYFVLCVCTWGAASAAGESSAGAPPDRIFWGDVHGHTSLSDGKGSVDDYFRNARDAARLDFAIVTDHDFGNASPWRMKREAWTLTQDKAEEYTVNGRFVAIAGYEWTSQTKYWTAAEKLFDGPVKFFNHKNVYFPSRVDYLFSAKDRAFMNPDLLADAVRAHGGLIHNNHPGAEPESREQFAYDPRNADVIANTEIMPDTVLHKGKTHTVDAEKVVRDFLKRGGRAGFVAGSDTHGGKPVARTAVLARDLSRSAIFDALRHRRNYAVSGARIVLDFKIDGHFMGEEFEVGGAPRIVADVQGTAVIEEVAIIRDGAVIHSQKPKAAQSHIEHTDESFTAASYYYLCVIQADTDEHGNKSHAWSSPIWVKRVSAKQDAVAPR